MSLKKSLLVTAAIAILLLNFTNVCPVGAEIDKITLSYQDSYKYEKTGNYTDAVRSLVPVYKAYPETYTVNLRLGWLFYLLQKYNDSLHYYRAAEKLAPYSLEVKNGLALVYLATQKWEQAEELCNQVLTIDYYNFYGNLYVISALKEQDKYKECEAVARKMLYILPTNTTFLNELGIALYYLKKDNDALTIFNSVLILDPENVTAKTFLAK